MVPIPEGVERHDEEPEDESDTSHESYADMAQSDGGGSTRLSVGLGKIGEAFKELRG